VKRCLLCLPLLALAPLGYFLGSYLDSAGVLPGGVGILISAGSMFILPWLVSGLFVVLPKTSWSIRRALVLCALLVQGFLLFTVVPAGATSETMGFAHRLRQEFPPSQLRDCAAHLRQKRRDGTLTLADKAKIPSFLMSETAVIVADSELPVSLRGRFQRVFIQQDRATNDEQVFFALDGNTGIICDSRTHVRGFLVCSMAEGVHAYRYQRP